MSAHLHDLRCAGCGLRLTGVEDLGIEARPNPVAELTARQRRCLALKARGLTNRSAALLLGVSEQTVKNHLRFAYRKLGVTNAAAAVAVVMRGGMGE